MSLLDLPPAFAVVVAWLFFPGVIILWRSYRDK